MKKKFYHIVWCILFWNEIVGQPLPCIPPAKMTSTCEEACIICDIDGFTGNNGYATYPGIAPPDFCTSTVHNIQWIAFMAGSQDLTLRISVSNCQNGGGLEMGIYQSLDCKTFQRVTKCDGNIPPNTSETFQNIVPLTIGQYYFLVIDGNMGDKCNYTISVLNGTTNVSKLTTSGSIEGKTSFCPGTTQEFEISPPPGATRFAWTLNGSSLGNSKKVQVNAATPGIHELCCTASNVCDTAPPACTTLVVRQHPTFILNKKLCGSDCLTVSDTTICEAGNYRIVRPDGEGCDSIFLVSVEKNLPAQTSIQTLICEGDTIFMAGKPFFKTGIFEEKMTTTAGCDSLLTLQLTTIQCEIRGTVAVKNVACFGGKTGGIDFQVTQGTPPFQYSWQRLGHPEKGAGSILQLFQNANISQLPQGSYAITVTDNFGNDVILLANVGEELPLQISTQLSDFQGFNVPCAGSSIGKITAQVSGGRQPYQFLWSTGSIQNPLENVPAGKYLLTLTDANGCTATAAAQLSEPTPISLDGVFTNPTCAGLNTGTAQILSATGGVGNFLFSMNGSIFSNQKLWENLPEGGYQITAQDANFCADTFGFQLLAPDIPVLNLEKNLEILLGESIQLPLQSNVVLQQIAWTPSEFLSCSDCLQPVASPVRHTKFFVEVSSLDNCTTSDSVEVRVRVLRDVFAPNVFSPNDDGLHDFFQIYGTSGVQWVRRFSIYNRWGELVFFRENMPIGDISGGWDGKFRYRPAPTGVYTWVAEIEFLDGKLTIEKGDVTLIR